MISSVISIAVKGNPCKYGVISGVQGMRCTIVAHAHLFEHMTCWIRSPSLAPETTTHVSMRLYLSRYLTHPNGTTT